MLAWRIVRLHGAERAQTERFVAREIFGYLRRAPRAACPEQTAA